MYALYDSQGQCRGKFNTREAALRSIPKDQHRHYKVLRLPQESDYYYGGEHNTEPHSAR